MDTQSPTVRTATRRGDSRSSKKNETPTDPVTSSLNRLRTLAKTVLFFRRFLTLTTHSTERKLPEPEGEERAAALRELESLEVGGAGTVVRSWSGLTEPRAVRMLAKWKSL